MTIKAFISDLDGTLINTQERSIQAHAKALLDVGYTVEIEQIRALYRFAFDSRDFLNRLHIHLTDMAFRKYIRGFRDHFYKEWKSSQVIPGALNALQRVQSHVEHMRLITSRHLSAQTRYEVQRFGLHKYFEKVLTRGDLAHAEGKNQIPLFPFVPHRRRLIKLALQDIKSEGDVWVVGDSVGELEAARSLGLVTIGVLTGFGSLEDLTPVANHVISSIAEIVQLI
jgi:phosphoglycolate phosphatase-like HAD superfamily hydrolase